MSEENIRKLLRMRRPTAEQANVFEEQEMEDTYGTGVTQVGPSRRYRRTIKTTERGGTVEPLKRSSPTTGLQKRSTPSDT